MLSQGNRAKPCKFRYVKPVVTFHTEDIAIEGENSHFRQPHLNLTLTSASNLDEYRQKPQSVGYIFAADSRPICASPSTSKQSCLKTRASMLNDSTRKKTQNGYSRSFKVICFNFQCQWIAIGGLHTQTRRNNFGLTHEISKDIATARSKSGNFRRHHAHLMPLIQRTPMNISITIISSQTRVSARHFRRW